MRLKKRCIVTRSEEKSEEENNNNQKRERSKILYLSKVDTVARFVCVCVCVSTSWFFPFHASDCVVVSLAVLLLVATSSS